MHTVKFIIKKLHPAKCIIKTEMHIHTHIHAILIPTDFYTTTKFTNRETSAITLRISVKCSSPTDKLTSKARTVQSEC